MIVEHDFLMWIKNKQNVDRFLIFARSLMKLYIHIIILHIDMKKQAKELSLNYYNE